MSIDGSQLSVDGGRGGSELMFDNRSLDGSRSFDGTGRSPSLGAQSALSLSLSLDLRSLDARSAAGRSQDGMDWDSSDWDSAGSVSSMGVRRLFFEHPTVTRRQVLDALESAKFEPAVDGR